MWRIKHRQKTSRSGDGSDVARRITEWYKLIKSVTAHNKGGCWLCRTWLCRATMVAFDGCFGHDFPEHRAAPTTHQRLPSHLPPLYRRSVFHLTALLPISTLLTHGIVPRSYRGTDTIETVVTTTHIRKSRELRDYNFNLLLKTLGIFEVLREARILR